MQAGKRTAGDVIPWELATDYCHHGIPLSNGVFGALVWFRERTIMLTINRADYWDHRGGTVWTEDCTFLNVKRLLERGDAAGAAQLYPAVTVNGKPKRPTRLPMGRYELKLKEGVGLESAALRVRDAEAVVECRYRGEKRLIRATMMIDRPVLLLSVDPELVEALEVKPAYDFPQVQAYYDDFGIVAHERIEQADVLGWVQPLPDDPACAVVAERSAGVLRIAAEYGPLAADARQAAMRRLAEVRPLGYEEAIAETRASWHKLWAQAAVIALPDGEIETMYTLGIYRMLGNSMPGGVAPTLQGPWVEEFRMPPWSCDYHFNINVQQCLWPAYGANLLPCLQPLFAMLDSWKPTLARNAKRFVGIDDGYMLGHSTDDRGKPVGGMWTGSIDQANTSWMAQMMWQYGRYSGDEAYLLREVYPFMKKALNVFMAMMERDGDTYALPVTVSPEYGGSSAEALGRNATFFLVNVHFLCEKLLEMAETHGIDAEYAAVVKDVREKLPRFAAGPRQPQEFNPKDIVRNEEIYLWENQPLAVSHRHHSHLAGIYPFDTHDMTDAASREAAMHAYRTWIDKGMGRWAGWSLPWASIVHNRFGNADMALFSLRILKEAYMMPGYASRHNANYAGFCQFAGGDVMQVEASIAAAAAILEMFVQCVRGTVRVFGGLSARFRDASFAGIRVEGAFLLSGTKADGRIRSVVVLSEKGGVLKLANPYGGSAYVHRIGVAGSTPSVPGSTPSVARSTLGAAGSMPVPVETAVIELQLAAGETVAITESVSYADEGPFG